MAWQTPKINWKKEDYFNIRDYSRIKENLEYLKSLAVQVYKEFGIAEMAADKTYGDYIYADEFNLLEQNLEKIRNGTYPFEIGKQKTYYPNQPTPDYKEFNRIESACLLIYENLNGQIAGKRRLAFTLGGDRL